MVSDDALISDIVKTDGLVCIGVPIGNLDFVQQWAASKTLALIEDLLQLRIMSDRLIHYHLVRFCGITRPSYMRCTLPPAVLQTQRVSMNYFDCAVAEEILIKGTGEHWQHWNLDTLAWHRSTL